MRQDAMTLEDQRLSGIDSQDQYQSIHERHRIFPAVFEQRLHSRIIDLSAGVGIVGKRIKDKYTYDELICNDMSENAIRTMRNAGLETESFDLDIAEGTYPLETGHFDAVISLATIEHIIHVDKFITEIHRILSTDGALYLSSPNYAGLLYLLPVVINGRTFHNPLDAHEKYEFYAHVRYFTYRTLLEYVQSFGFYADTVYLGRPCSGSRYLALARRSPLKAFIYRCFFNTLYHIGSPRWASEPVICFKKRKKTDSSGNRNIRKVIL
jgi:SAM-dependent methyltransferase